MNAKKSEAISIYQHYLPATLQADTVAGQLLLAFEKILGRSWQEDLLIPDPIHLRFYPGHTPKAFLLWLTAMGQLLLAFEKVLGKSWQDILDSGKIITSDNLLGFEEILDPIHLYFEPKKTPDAFLSWLAGWVALSVRDDWSVTFKQEMISRAVDLYRKRGTKVGLIEILKIYLKNAGFGEKVEVFDQFTNFPNYFQVQLTLKQPDPEEYWQLARIARSIIDREKPAQTFYILRIRVPTMRIPLQPEDPQQRLVICEKQPDGTYSGNTILGTVTGTIG